MTERARTWTLVIAASAAVVGYAMWKGDRHSKAEAVSVAVVTGAAAPSTTAQATADATAPQEADRGPGLQGTSLLETATADDTGPGSATLRLGDGSVERIPVGGWFDGAVLTKVSDYDATFTMRGTQSTLRMSRATNTASDPGIGSAGVPRVVYPGIAHAR